MGLPYLPEEVQLLSGPFLPSKPKLHLFGPVIVLFKGIFNLLSGPCAQEEPFTDTPKMACHVSIHPAFIHPLCHNMPTVKHPFTPAFSPSLLIHSPIHWMLLCPPGTIGPLEYISELGTVLVHVKFTFQQAHWSAHVAGPQTTLPVVRHQMQSMYSMHTLIEMPFSEAHISAGGSGAVIGSKLSGTGDIPGFLEFTTCS